jgi:hypothetical protein
MSWKTENAIKRIFNAFKRSKDKIYTEDIEALKLLNTELNNDLKKTVVDNILFAKLLCYIIDRNLHCNGDIKESIRVASDILKEPLDVRINMMQINLNNKELDNYLIYLGIKEQVFKSDEIENNKIISENQNELAKKMQTNWTYEKVSKSFYNTANDLIKDINNYI